MSELSVGQLKGLAANENVITVPSGHVLNAPGHVIQVVSTTVQSSVSTTSAAYVDVTGVSVSITPKFASSKMLIFVNGQAGNNNNSQAAGLTLLRDNTQIYVGTGATIANLSSVVYTANSFIQATFALNHLDSPATTLPITYKLQFRAESSGTAFVGRRGNDAAFSVPTTITVMEVVQ